VFDVIVCGAGPAGSVAATLLARGGARVLVVDRARFPRDKLCGDTINPGTIAALRRLGLTSRFESRAIEVHGMLVTGERGVQVMGDYGEVRGLALPRRDLDHALLEEAAAAGARVEEGVLVRAPLLESEGQLKVRGIVIAGRDGRDVRIPSPLVIAADGRRSRLALTLKLTRHPPRPRRWAIGAYFEGITGLTAYGEMHVRHGRYLGVAPLGTGAANVCLVTANQRGLEDPRRALREAIAHDWQLADRVTSARMISPPTVLGPLAVDACAAGVPGLLLAGDAAGFIDPMTGDGLRFAVIGAELAANVALAALARRVRSPHRTLGRLRRGHFAGKWRFNRVLRQVVGSAPALELAGFAASSAPGLLRRTIAFAGDVSRE
jgi:geranylgeranyl reductase family protein